MLANPLCLLAPAPIEFSLPIGDVVVPARFRVAQQVKPVHGGLPAIVNTCPG